MSQYNSITELLEDFAVWLRPTPSDSPEEVQKQASDSALIFLETRGPLILNTTHEKPKTAKHYFEMFSLDLTGSSRGFKSLTDRLNELALSGLEVISVSPTPIPNSFYITARDLP